MATNPTLLDSLNRTAESLSNRAHAKISIRETLLAVDPRNNVKLSKESRSALDGKFSGDGTPAGTGFVPFESLLTRDLQATVFPSGGAFVGNDMQEPINLLLNRTVAIRAGAKVTSGLNGNAIFPRIESPVTPTVVSEIGAATQSDVTTGQLVAQPRRITVKLVLSNQLLLQTSGAAEEYLKTVILNQIAVKLDALVLNGQGASSEPLGLFQTPGVNTVTFGGSTTWTQLLSMEQTIAGLNADENLSFAISPATRNKWKQVVKLGGYPSYLMEANNTVNGYPAITSNQLAGTERVIFGDWSKCHICIWGTGADFVADIYSKAAQGETVYIVNLWADVVWEHPQAFIVSTDGGNQ